MAAWAGGDDPAAWVAFNDYHRYLLDLILINVILAVGLNIVKGFAGQVTVGHVAMMAIGAYTSAVLTTKSARRSGSRCPARCS